VNLIKKPKQIVREGYDRVSHAYRTADFEVEKSDYKTRLSLLMPHLAPGSAVLDLGCGCGIPVARTLSERFRVTGVDFSAVQIDRARKLVPRASFVRADITQVNFTLGQFDAIVSLFTIIHLPLDEQLPLFRSIHSWLRGAGFLLATVGDRSWTGVETPTRKPTGNGLTRWASESCPICSSPKGTAATDCSSQESNPGNRTMLEATRDSAARQPLEGEEDHATGETEAGVLSIL
jgi:SAM-dependent methyltransferase